MTYFLGMNSLARELVNLGLSEKEAAVYLALLEISPASIQDIATKANVNRATTYLLVESLSKRGIASTTQKDAKQLFVAEPPERLVTILRLQRQELEEKERELVSTMPFFNALYNSKADKPQIQYFEGMEGLLAAREIFMNENGEFVQILPIDDANAVAELVEKRPDHLQVLTEQHIPSRALYVTANPDAIRSGSYPHAQVRTVSTSKFPVHAEMSIRGNHIFLFTFLPNVLTVIIANKTLSDTMRALFEMAWESQGEK